MNFLHAHRSKTNLTHIDSFIQKVKAVDEPDYVDCSREWNRELLHLKSNLKDLPAWVEQSITEMQDNIQSNPNWNIESMRQQILEDTNHLRLAVLADEKEEDEENHHPGLLETSDTLISSFSF